MTKETNRLPVAVWAGLFLLAAIAIYLYIPVFKRFAQLVSNGQDFDYIYLAPVVLSYLIWDRKADLARAIKKPSFWGLIPFSFGIILFWLGELAGEFYTQFVAFILMAAGAVWAIFGDQVFRYLRFTFVTSLFFLPFPNFITQLTTQKLQLISSALGVAMLRLLGRSVYREGNVIDLGYHKLQVVEACSGLRYLFALLILGLLMGYIMRLRTWKRLVLVVAAIPIAVLSNAIRIMATAILMEHFGPDAIEGIMHDFEGFLIFGVAFLCMYLLSRILNLISRERPEPKKPEDPGEQAASSGKGSNPFLAYSLLAVMVLLMGASCYTYSFVNFREAVPTSRPLEEFPSRIGDYSGQKALLEQKFLNSLHLTSYIMADYVGPERIPINFYVAYYESQRKGESIHTPATCLRGAGWVFTKGGAKTVDIPGIGKIHVREALLKKGSQSQLVYYWFQKGERTIDNVWALKWYVFWDALTRQRTDGALVRIITPVPHDESIEKAEKRLDRFLQAAIPELYRFLPTGDTKKAAKQEDQGLAKGS